jgi:hypothetical protein
MKTISLRSLSRTASTLTESVYVTSSSTIIGIYRPVDAPPPPEVPWSSTEIVAADTVTTVVGVTPEQRTVRAAMNHAIGDAVKKR